MNYKKIVIVTNMPSPYQVDFFNALSRKVDLTVIYVKKTEPYRKWNYDSHIEHDHVFLRGEKAFKLRTFIQKGSVFIVSGYNLPEFLRIMSYLTFKKVPWVFWGEKIRLNKLYIKKITVLNLIKHARAILGIGGVAARLYYELTNVPTFIFPYHINTKRFNRKNIKEKSKVDFLFSGQLIERKGIFDILTAFEIVYKKFGDRIFLHIIGDGPLEDFIKSRTQGYKDKVHLYGFVRYEDIPKIYAKGDVFLFPSLYDGWGVSLSEGMAAGMVPISTFTTGAATDLILHSYNGFIIPPSTPALLSHYMEKLIKHPKKIIEMGQKASTYVCEKVDINKGVQKLLSILGEI